MIQVCYYCQQIYGEKEPFDLKEETSGECPLCHFFFEFWYRLRQAGHVTEPATKFIRDCRLLYKEQEAAAEMCLH